MCGISGFVSKRKITKEELRIMNDTMTHRGPDDSGVELYEGKDGYTIGLAQRRLAILDLSPLGHQPMHSNDGRVTLVFNGEIYNFLELKEELKDYEFKSTCDTEVIIASYLKWGIDMVDHIHGMFAIALYDRETDDIYLIRDRIGKKPLFYWLDGDGIVFASELKPIMKCPGFHGRIRRSVIPRYLYQQYIIAPDTIFKDVEFALDTVLQDQWYKLQLGLRYPAQIAATPEFKSEKHIVVSSKRETVNPPKKFFLFRWFQKKHTVLNVDVVEKSPYVENQTSRYIEIIK